MKLGYSATIPQLRTLQNNWDWLKNFKFVIDSLVSRWQIAKVNKDQCTH